MLNSHFGILAAALPLFGTLGYAWDTLHGTAQPNRVTWLLWAIAPLIAFAAELTRHTELEVALLTFAVGFGPLLVIAASLANRQAYWQLGRFDIVCGVLSVVALGLWAITGQAVVAIVLRLPA